MAAVLSAVSGTVIDIIKPSRVLISVFDKEGIVEFAKFLSTQAGCEILSTGGTADKIRGAGIPCTDVSDYTGSPECLDGRVKTLHPKIHGGILAVRSNEKHEREMREIGISHIDMTVANLYPFEAAVAREGHAFATCVENIDIGGPSMLRSTAKNHSFTAIVTSPRQYKEVMNDISTFGGTTLALRKRLAATAFAVSAAYDSAISAYFAANISSTSAPAITSDDTSAMVIVPNADTSSNGAVLTTRTYVPELSLKYGCNPQQLPASILSLEGQQLPFTVKNGTPGYINLLDALNAWQLVSELKQATGLVAAASFKHVSPAGAALAVPLSMLECQAYEVPAADATQLTPAALAYVRARNADPMCSFGDFAAISDVIDEDTALYLKKEVSDGIIAAGYTEKAQEILASKKNGGFIILEANCNYTPPMMEYREVYGACFAQKRNTTLITKEHVSSSCVTKNKLTDTAQGTDAVIRDMLLACITLKYTQSNSVGYAKNGMMIGIGAGQQSRVDCVKLAARKVTTWSLRQHEMVLGLKFKDGLKRSERVNARVRFIEGDFTAEERTQWEQNFVSDGIISSLSTEEKQVFMSQQTGVVLASDAFFPFRDNIDHASKVGVNYVVQPGGSIADEAVTKACDEYGMVMCMTGVRLFHH